MRKYLWLLGALILISTPLFVLGQSDTRKVSTDSQDYSCYRATVVGTNTCFTPSVNATIAGTLATSASGTSFNDIKLISGTNPATPGSLGNLAGTTFVSITQGTVAVSNIAGGTIAVSSIPAASGTSFVSVTGGTVAISSIAGGTVAVSSIPAASGTSFVSVTGGTVAVSSVAGGTIAISAVGPLTGTSFVSVGGGTVAVSAVGPLTGTSFVSIGAGTVAISNVASGTIAVSNIAGGTIAVSSIAGGTVAISAQSALSGTSFVSITAGTVAISAIGPLTGTSFVNINSGTGFVNINTGTGFVNIIPIAIVTQGVGNKTVSTTGTSLRLAAQAARMVVIKANAANTNNVYVVPGGTTSTSYKSTTNPGGLQLAAKESVTLPLISNIQEIVIDVDTNGEGVNYTYIGY